MTPEPNRPDEREAAIRELIEAAEPFAAEPNNSWRAQRLRDALTAIRRDAPREGASVDFEEAWRSRSANDLTERENAYAWFRAGYRNAPDRAPREGGEAEVREAFILGYKHGACHYIGGNSEEELHAAAMWSVDNQDAEVGKFGTPADAPERDAVGALPAKWRERKDRNPSVEHAYYVCADELAAALAAAPAAAQENAP